MRYFLFVSICTLLWFACARQSYPQPTTVTAAAPLTTAELQPRFDKMWYRCVIDGKYLLTSYHWSGILLFRKLESGELRVVFQAEMGATFFDFGWDKEGNFTVCSIMQAMNKSALIATLRKDFEMLLFVNKASEPLVLHQFKDADVIYYKYALPKGFVYYLLNNQDQWLGIQNADDKKKVTVFNFSQPTPIGQLPTQFTINHLKAHFTVQLTQFKPEQDTNDASE